jgi:quinoprotein glucose dehydrogenase
MRTQSRVALAAALVIAILVLGILAYLALSTQRPGGPDNGQVELAPVWTGLAWPIALAFSGDGRVFFAERFTGRIQILGNATIPDSTFFTIPEVASSGEQGVLGLALDPAFPNHPYLYAYYTRDDTANGSLYNRIVRIRASGSVGTGLEVLRDRIGASTIHNSGVIEFGPDGKLYALVGDAANSASAQDLSTPNGKVLRIDPDGSTPSDNPFVGRPGADADVYTLGHWNMFGIAWNPTTHAVYVTENGPQDSDEINLLVPGGNYGWPNVRGIAHVAPYVDPIIAYTPVIVPTNAAFYTALVPASSRGHLIVGSFNDRRLHDLALTPDGASVINETFLATAADGILDVEMGLDGYLWITTPSAIYRLLPVPAGPVPYLVGPSPGIAWIAVRAFIPVPAKIRCADRRNTQHPGSLSRGRTVSRPNAVVPDPE